MHASSGLELRGVLEQEYEGQDREPEFQHRAAADAADAARHVLWIVHVAKREVAGNAHKEKVKLTFPHGASLPDPDRIFNADLKGNTWRAIDWFEGDKVNAPALKNLVLAAIDYNQLNLKKKAASRTRKKA